MSDDLKTFREGLRDLGWIEGENITIEFRWAEGRFERLPELANDLVRLNVDVIVAPTSIYADAAKRRDIGHTNRTAFRHSSTTSFIDPLDFWSTRCSNLEHPLLQL